jgi:hypothetical protein
MNTTTGRFKFPLPCPIPWKGGRGARVCQDVGIKNLL